jgi:hypothetical protein
VHELKNAVEDQFVLGHLKSFNPVTQELYQHLPAIIHTEIHAKIKAFEERLDRQSTVVTRRRGCRARRLKTGMKTGED